VDCAQLANTTASGVVALACLVFAVVYHLNAPWRDSAVGRHLMAFTLAIGALTAYTVIITFWPEGVPATVLRFTRTLLLLVIAGLIVQRIHMVLTFQHHPDRLHSSESPSDDPPA